MKNCIISFGIDLSKVSKEKIKVDDKGRKWLYLQASITVQEDQYGNQVATWENQTKEERLNGKRNYLGNGKITFFDSGATVIVSPSELSENQNNDVADLPF